MNALNKAIIDLLLKTDNDFADAINGKLFYQEAPQTAGFPYCVFDYSRDEDDSDTEDAFRNFTVDFTFFDNAPSSLLINALQEKLEGVFNNSENTLIVQGWLVIQVTKTRTVNLGKNNRASSDVQSYIIELQKAR